MAHAQIRDKTILHKTTIHKSAKIWWKKNGSHNNLDNKGNSHLEPNSQATGTKFIVKKKIVWDT